jgi:aspartyl aminopeptidase
MVEVLSGEGVADLTTDDIVASDLMLYDAQPPSFGGPRGEWLHASRIDNLASCHAAITALGSARARTPTQVIVLNDHEEVGSESAHGALSRFLLGVLERLDAEVGRAAARSLLISIDMAHAVHPAHADRHDPQHRPELGGGPVVKVNAGQRYATDAPARAVFVQACRAAGFEPQYFAGRNDVTCGTTIGPLASARTGIRAVDVGNPMLSMHSCRETADVRDIQPMIDVLTWVLDHAVPPDPAV